MVTVIIAWIVVGLAALAGFVLIQYARKNRKPKVVGYEPASLFKVPRNLHNTYVGKHEWTGSYRVAKSPRTVVTTPSSDYPLDEGFSTGLLTGIVAAELLTDNTPSPSYTPDPSPGFEGFGGGSTGGGGSDGSWTPDTSSSSYDSGSSSSYDSGSSSSYDSGSSSDSSSSSSDSSSW